MYSAMLAAHKSAIKRVGTVLLGGGVGGLRSEVALKAMNDGYFRAYEEIDEILFG